MTPSFTNSWERRSPRKEKNYLPILVGLLLFLGALYVDKFYLSYEVLTHGF